MPLTLPFFCNSIMFSRLDVPVTPLADFHKQKSHWDIKSGN